MWMEFDREIQTLCDRIVDQYFVNTDSGKRDRASRYQ